MSQAENTKVLGWRRVLCARLHLEHADVPPTDASDESRSAGNGNWRLVRCKPNTSRVEELQPAARREVEDATSFLEEAASFRKEERKAVEVDLLIVRFDLSEVRVGREIEREISRKRIPYIEAGFVRRRSLVAESQRGARR